MQLGTIGTLSVAHSKLHLVVEQRQVQLPQLLQRVGQVGVSLAVGVVREADGSQDQCPSSSSDERDARNSAILSTTTLRPPRQQKQPHTSARPGCCTMAMSL